MKGVSKVQTLSSSSEKHGKKKVKPDKISEHFIEVICERLASNKQVRRTLPEKGRIHIDRQLPFLCVYRRPSQCKYPGTEQLVTGEPSYLKASGKRSRQKELSLLVDKVSTTLGDKFGAFLLVEIWAATETKYSNNGIPDNKPVFSIFRHGKKRINSTVNALESALMNIKIQNESAIVKVISKTKVSPPDMQPLILPRDTDRVECHVLGIEVRPIYFNPDTDQEFPVVLRTLRHQLSVTLKACFYKFTQTQTKFHPPNFQVFGRRSFVKNVWEVDRKLAEISNSFDFLLLLTPTNAEEAWNTFKRKRFKETPQFTYRRMPIDPALIKRKLFNIPIERLEDPTLSHLFREQQSSLDRKLTMLSERGTKRFLYGGIQLFGNLDNALMELANKILDRFPARSHDDAVGQLVDAETFAERVASEIEFFRKTVPDVESSVELRDDVNGLVVSKGKLLVGSQMKIPASRVEALLQHEVGTHVVTYINGMSQPLKQLYTGLPEYDSLQEGLAVFAEYLVGGLTRPRMRIIAARVLAISLMLEGASFNEVFSKLHETHHFNQRLAFMITMRIFREGGYVKDFVYLRGLMKLLEYLKKGGAFETLFVGKFGIKHIPIIQELLWRKVLKPPRLLPRYFYAPQTIKKLERIRKGISVLELVNTIEKKEKS